MNEFPKSLSCITIFKKSLLIVSCIMIPLASYLQSCLPNGLTLSTQQQIDDFSAMYPSCTEIGGDLIIISSAINAISSLEGLSQLTAINGDLRMADNSLLLNLSGLENLESLTGSLLIFENNALEDLNALSNLTSIGGSLSVGKNDNLISLFGLHSIGFGITDLRIFDNAILSNCSISNFCSYLSNGANHTISSNAFGCNESSQILSICLSENPCIRNRLRVNFTPILDGVYQAIEEVTSVGEVPNTGAVDFIAGICVTLDTGFKVRSGATFTATIEDCGF